MHGVIKSDYRVTSSFIYTPYLRGSGLISKGAWRETVASNSPGVASFRFFSNSKLLEQVTPPLASAILASLAIITPHGQLR